MSNQMRTWSLLVLRQFLHLAVSALHVLAAAASATFKSRAALHLENLALRHQLGILRRSVKRPKLTPADRLLWAWLCEVWDFHCDTTVTETTRHTTARRLATCS